MSEYFVKVETDVNTVYYKQEYNGEHISDYACRKLDEQSLLPIDGEISILIDDTTNDDCQGYWQSLGRFHFSKDIKFVYSTKRLIEG